MTTRENFRGMGQRLQMWMDKRASFLPESDFYGQVLPLHLAALGAPVRITSPIVPVPFPTEAVVPKPFSMDDVD